MRFVDRKSGSIGLVTRWKYWRQGPLTVSMGEVVSGPSIDGGVTGIEIDMAPSGSATVSAQVGGDEV